MYLNIGSRISRENFTQIFGPESGKNIPEKIEEKTNNEKSMRQS